MESCDRIERQGLALGTQEVGGAGRLKLGLVGHVDRFLIGEPFRKPWYGGEGGKGDELGNLVLEVRRDPLDEEAAK